MVFFFPCVLIFLIALFFALPLYFRQKLILLPTKKITSSHVSALDSLRGVAALLVCGGHYLDHLALDSYFPAHQSVLLFFVLSGYVLCSSLSKNYHSYSYYFIRRWFRIYPAYYFSIILTTIFVCGVGVVRLDYVLRWSILINDINGFFSPIIMTDRPMIGHPIDSVSWSLTYEMLISIFFPLLFFSFVSIGNKVIRNFIMLGYIGLSWWLFQKYQLGIISIFYYSCYFIIGMLLFLSIKRMQVFSSSLFTFCGVICFFNNSIFIIINYKIYNIYNVDILSALGAVLLIIACIYNRWMIKFMALKIIKFYGSISYSFYLIHGPMLWVIIRFFDTRNIAYALVSSFLLATLLSYISYSYIEKPFIKLGSYLALSVEAFQKKLAALL